MRVISGLALLMTLFAPCAPSAREACATPVYNLCTDEGSATVGGIRLTPHCIRHVGTQSCVDTSPLDQCAALRNSQRCHQTSRTCVDYRNGECRQWRHEYSCLNEDEDMSPATLTATEFGPTQETIVNNCTQYEQRGECDLLQTVTVEGNEARDINRKIFSRSWWRRERSYSCVVPGEGANTCGALESDPTCTLQGNTCLVEDANGLCSNREFHYRCGVETSDLQTSCEPINVCVGDTCLGVEQETSDDFGTSAAWLNILAEMQTDFRGQQTSDPNDIRFFEGMALTCSKFPGRDCCDLGGVFGGTCPESASILRDKRMAGATHYVGVTCQQKVFGLCVKRRYHYCSYNSKFGRVFIEGFKDQFDEDFGAPLAMDCGHVTVEDFANIDVSAMDLSPVFGDIMEDIQLPVAEGLEDFFEDRWPNASGEAAGAFEDLGR